jgi:hypothetical protein
LPLIFDLLFLRGDFRFWRVKVAGRRGDWVKAAGWKMVEIRSGHDAMVIAPDRMADMLDAESG